MKKLRQGSGAHLQTDNFVRAIRSAGAAREEMKESSLFFVTR